MVRLHICAVLAGVTLNRIVALSNGRGHKSNAGPNAGNQQFHHFKIPRSPPELCAQADLSSATRDTKRKPQFTRVAHQRRASMPIISNNRVDQHTTITGTWASFRASCYRLKALRRCSALGRPRMTRGQSGSLPLFCIELSSTTFRQSKLIVLASNSQKHRYTPAVSENDDIATDRLEQSIRFCCGAEKQKARRLRRLRVLLEMRAGSKAAALPAVRRRANLSFRSLPER